MSWHPRIENALLNFCREEIPTSIPLRLEFLETQLNALLLKEFRRQDIFAGIDVLFIQHHLGPFIAKLHAMFNNELDRSRCWFIDIPYSTNHSVKDYIGKNICSQDQASRPFTDPLAPYSEIQSIRVARLMEKIIGRKDPQSRLLVLDDGAYFARYLDFIKNDQPELLQHFKKACLVEQTTRGHRYLETHKDDLIRLCDLSIVSIARCKTKLQFESPFIGASMGRALGKALGEDRLRNFRSIGIIGYGTVGEATVDDLLRKSPKARIEIVDIDEGKLRAAGNKNVNAQAMKQLRDDGSYELVVGCTGYNSFKLEQRYCLADGAFLASASSAAVEFNRAGFIELADRDPQDEIELLNREDTQRKGIHAPIEIRYEGGKKFTFLNAGFPVNFDGQLECLPTRMIQSTHALMIAASWQALTQGAGFSRIEKTLDESIYDMSIKEL